MAFAHTEAASDEQVAAFRERPLEGAYPYLWLDAKQEKDKRFAVRIHEQYEREVKPKEGDEPEKRVRKDRRVPGQARKGRLSAHARSGGSTTPARRSTLRRRGCPRTPTTTPPT